MRSHRRSQPPGGAVAVAAILVVASTALGQPAAWEPRGPGGGGALFGPSFSPHSPGELYVSCDMSELFHSTDMGLAWGQVDFRQFQASPISSVQFTEDPLVLYAIDGTNVGGLDLLRPAKSTDGGATWTVLPGDPTFGDTWSLWADPADQSRVLLSDTTRLFFSSDGGINFTERHADPTGFGLHVAGVFWDGAEILVGTNGGLVVSTDGGASFALAPRDGLPAGEGMSSFAGAREGGVVRLACVTHDECCLYPGKQASDHLDFRGVYTLDRSVPAATWTPSVTGLDPADHPWFVGMARGEVDVAYLGGGGDNFVPTVYKTIDGGASWQPVLGVAGNANCATGWSGDGGDRGWDYGECALGFAVSPVDANRVALSDFGFVHVTDDGGLSWRQAYVAAADQNPAGAPTPTRRSYHSVGLENTTAWWLTWADPQTLIGCASDIRGTRSTDGGTTWGFDYTGHAENSTYHCVRHEGSGILYAATSSVHDMYQSTRLQDGILDAARGDVIFSTDAGATWQELHDFGTSVVWLALNPTDPNSLYASVVNAGSLGDPVGAIHVTRNLDQGAAATWTQLAPPTRTEGHPFNVVILYDGTIVATYSGRRNAAGVFTASSGVFVSNNDGASWIDRSDPGMHYWTKDITLDPADPTQSTWYVGVWSGWGGAPNGLGGLYRTTDRGQTWTRINALDRVTRLTVSPLDPDEGWLTTETEGLWRTTDLRSVAPTFTRVDYPFRQPERVLYNPHDPYEIWVTSFGNGLKVGRVDPPPITNDLWRDATVTSLTPLSPPLATVLPLTAADVVVVDFAPGDLDPDAAIVDDGTRPLVFYSVSNLPATQPIRVSVTAARRLRIDF